MKTVKSITILAILVMTCGTINAQMKEYKLPVSGTKTLKIKEVGKVTISGYDGNEIIFSTERKNNDQSERAEGLSAISSMGLKDNSGIGLSVVESGEVIEVNPMSKRSGPRYEIKVPSNVKVHYEHSTAYGSKLNVKDISSELEISTNHSSVMLENIQGPVTVNTVHGKIEASFSTLSQASPSSILSVHGLVDIALPGNTSADIKMKTTWGEIYTDLPINFENADSNSSSTIANGKLGAGGVALNIRSTHNNIYLRQKK